MKNSKFSRLFAAALVVACLALTGCKPQTEEVEKVVVVKTLTSSDKIIGKWTYDDVSWNTYGSYACNITAGKVETASYGVQNGTVYIQETSETSGYLYYKFEDDITGYGPAPEYTPYTIECAGKWGAIAYKDLTANGVHMCDAYKTYDFVATLEDAVLTYTIDNGWFDYLNTTEFLKVE